MFTSGVLNNVSDESENNNDDDGDDDVCNPRGVTATCNIVINVVSCSTFITKHPVHTMQSVVLYHPVSGDHV